jgi:cystathionine beta-lyase/cystathionine gamma-synthase
LAFSSGLAATDCFDAVGLIDEVIAMDEVGYGGTYRLFCSPMLVHALCIMLHALQGVGGWGSAERDKTLHLKSEHCENGEKIAEFLNKHQVKRVALSRTAKVIPFMKLLKRWWFGGMDSFFVSGKRRYFCCWRK